VAGALTRVVAPRRGYIRNVSVTGISVGSKASRLADGLLASIDEGSLPAGTFLGTKAMLLGRYEVSPGTLNEALRLLQVRDYVVVRPGPKGGVFVGQKRERGGLTNALLTGQHRPQHVNDVFRIQDALQELVVVEGATHCDRRHVAAIEGALDRLAEAGTPKQILEAGWDVDREIARAGNNRVLTAIYCEVVDSIQASIQWFDIDGAMAEIARSTHAAMARAVIANDVELAAEIARRHSPDGGAGPGWRPGDTS
jgi:GntR family transcriptional regulator, transcriptional repressor for pyruvate dehydrogenase complex